jgi:hypothetical protein
LALYIDETTLNWDEFIQALMLAIGTIFEATSMMNFNKTPSTKTILL